MANQDGTPDLEFVTTDELLDELFKRHTHAVWVSLNSVADELTMAGFRSTGEPFVCFGLAGYFQHRLLTDIVDKGTDTDGGP